MRPDLVANTLQRIGELLVVAEMIGIERLVRVDLGVLEPHVFDALCRVIGELPESTPAGAAEFVCGRVGDLHVSAICHRPGKEP